MLTVLRVPPSLLTTPAILFSKKRPNYKGTLSQETPIARTVPYKLRSKCLKLQIRKRRSLKFRCSLWDQILLTETKGNKKSIAHSLARQPGKQASLAPDTPHCQASAAKNAKARHYAGPSLRNRLQKLVLHVAHVAEIGTSGTGGQSH